MRRHVRVRVSLASPLAHKTCHCSRTGRRFSTPLRATPPSIPHGSSSAAGSPGSTFLKPDRVALIRLLSQVTWGWGSAHGSAPSSPWWPTAREQEKPSKERLVQDRPQSGGLGETPTGQRRGAPLSSLAEGGQFQETNSLAYSRSLLLDEVLSPSSCPGLRKPKCFTSQALCPHAEGSPERPGPLRIRVGDSFPLGTPRERRAGQDGPSTHLATAHLGKARRGGGGRTGQPGPWGWGRRRRQKLPGQPRPPGGLEQVMPGQRPDGPTGRLWDHYRRSTHRLHVGLPPRLCCFQQTTLSLAGMPSGHRVCCHGRRWPSGRAAALPGASCPGHPTEPARHRWGLAVPTLTGPDTETPRSLRGSCRRHEPGQGSAPAGTFHPSPPWALLAPEGTLGQPLLLPPSAPRGNTTFQDLCEASRGWARGMGLTPGRLVDNSV